MILHGRVLEQSVDRTDRGRFVKEVVVTAGSVPLAMVRKRDASKGGGTLAPVLLVHGFGQNRYAWHLPSRSFANFLAREGYDVFNLDLRGHGRSRHMGAKRCRGVDDYVHEDLPSAVAEVQALSGQRQVFIVGHSLGGLVSYAAAPDLSGATAGLISIGSPYQFTRGSLPLACIGFLIRSLDSAAVMRANPAISVRQIGSFLNMIARLAETPFYPLPLKGWHAGAVEPEVLEEHFRLAFDWAGLAELSNMFQWASEGRFGGRDSDFSERFEKQNTPLLVMAGTNDDLAPPESVRPAFAKSRATDKQYRAFPLGHIDLLMGHDAPLMTWSTAARWLHERTSTDAKARSHSQKAA